MGCLGCVCKLVAWGVWDLSVSGVSGVMGVGFELCQNRSEGQLLEKSCPV